jgi:hypothetical protein
MHCYFSYIPASRASGRSWNCIVGSYHTRSHFANADIPALLFPCRSIGRASSGN